MICCGLIFYIGVVYLGIFSFEAEFKSLIIVSLVTSLSNPLAAFAVGVGLDLAFSSLVSVSQNCQVRGHIWSAPYCKTKTIRERERFASIYPAFR